MVIVALPATMIISGAGAGHGAGTQAAELESQSRAPAGSDSAVVSERIGDLTVTLRDASTPGVVCVTIEGIVALDGGSSTGICTQASHAEKFGLVASTKVAGGSQVIYGVGPAGTASVERNGESLAANGYGLFALTGIAERDRGTIRFRGWWGARSLEYGPLPALPRP